MGLTLGHGLSLPPPLPHCPGADAPQPRAPVLGWRKARAALGHHGTGAVLHVCQQRRDGFSSVYSLRLPGAGVTAGSQVNPPPHTHTHTCAAKRSGCRWTSSLYSCFPFPRDSGSQSFHLPLAANNQTPFPASCFSQTQRGKRKSLRPEAVGPGYGVQS